MSAGKKDKELLELIGIKISPTLKQAIEEESKALEIPPSTYARQLLSLGWRTRHEAPVAKNPREQIMIDRFNELPMHKQEDIMVIMEALRDKHLEDLKRIEDTEAAEKLFDKPPVKKIDDN